MPACDQLHEKEQHAAAGNHHCPPADWLCAGTVRLSCTTRTGSCAPNAPSTAICAAGAALVCQLHSCTSTELLLLLVSGQLLSSAPKAYPVTATTRTTTKTMHEGDDCLRMLPARVVLSIRGQRQYLRHSLYQHLERNTYVREGRKTASFKRVAGTGRQNRSFVRPGRSDQAGVIDVKAAKSNAKKVFWCMLHMLRTVARVGYRVSHQC
jgi:hypothetical protein